MIDNNLLFGTDNSDLIFGTNHNNHIEAGAGDDTIIASQGDDIIFGGIGTDTYDYGNLPGKQPITASLGLVFENITVANGPGFSIVRRVNIAVNKNQLGHDVIIDTVGGINLDAPTLPIVGKLVAPIGRNNTFQADASSPGGFIDLSQNLYIYNGAARVDGSVEFTIENFVNAIGSGNPDRLIGSKEDNQLEGEGGNDFLDGNAGNDTLIGSSGSDTLVGGNGKDTLLGSNASVSGNEIDVLTGGANKDLFILGDSEGTLYDANQEADFAQIEDLAVNDLIQLSARDTYSVSNLDGQLELFVIQDSGEDLIARITTDDSIDILLDETFQIASGETLDIFVGV